MTATAHALVGGVIAASIPNPMIGLPLIAVSHPILDLIPHWDVGWGWKKKTKLSLFLQASFDLLLGVGLAYFLFGRHIDLAYFFGAVFLAEVWDLMECPYWFLGWKFPPFSTFYKVQSKLQGKASTVFTGILTQLGTIAALVVVFRLAS